MISVGAAAGPVAPSTGSSGSHTKKNRVRCPCRTPCHPNNESKTRRGFANRPGGEIPVLSKTHVMLGDGSALLMSSSASEKDPPAADSGDLEDMENQPRREAQQPCRSARNPQQGEVFPHFIPDLCLGEWAASKVPRPGLQPCSLQEGLFQPKGVKPRGHRVEVKTVST
jgi:hypothetical protein